VFLALRIVFIVSDTTLVTDKWCISAEFFLFFTDNVALHNLQIKENALASFFS
jgi:methylaspartate ammonia-lyase